MPRSKRSSVVEAHEIFTKYHRHREGDSNEDTASGTGGSDDDDLLKGIGDLDLGGRDHKVTSLLLIDCISDNFNSFFSYF